MINMTSDDWMLLAERVVLVGVCLLLVLVIVR